MRFANYSDSYYPDRHDLAQYLSDFSSFFNLSVAFNTNIIRIDQDPSTKHFTIDVDVYTVSPFDHHSDDEEQHCTTDCDDIEGTAERRQYRCKYLFVATGLSKMNIPPIRGIQSATSYSEMSTDLDRYKNKKIAVLGGGNSAFEVAQKISTVSAYTHIFPVSMPGFAYETVRNLSYFFFILITFSFLFLFPVFPRVQSQ